jgi:DNA (cytosine-5)-methyltransferase 1
MSKKMIQRETSHPKMISLFTGAGGLDLGLEDAGFETLVTNEIDPAACETLRANKTRQGMTDQEFKVWFQKQIQQRCYNSSTNEEIYRLEKRLIKHPFKIPYLKNATIIEGDIRDISTDSFLSAAKAKPGEIDLIAGGAPCQPFSRAGKRQTVECDTGRLFLEFVRLVDEIRPRWFLFENVKGLVISKTEVLFIHCSDCSTVSTSSFSERQQLATGANLKPTCPDCLSANAEYRWEVRRGGSLDIIVNEFESKGYKCTSKVLNAADFGAPQSRERLFIVGTRDGEDFTFPSPTHANKTPKSESSQSLLLLNDTPSLLPWRTMYDALWQKGHFKYGCLDLSKAVLWVKNVVRPHDEPVTWSLNRPSPTIGAHQGAKLAIAPLGVPEAQLKRQQWHVLGKRQRDLPPVHVEHEYLSDEELLRLQTFPVGWYLFGTRMQRAFQIGNAVPPVLAAAMGEALIKAMGKKKPLIKTDSKSKELVPTR